MKMLLLPRGENDYMDIKDGNPLFTIIVAVLNSKESLEGCIESVNNQTYPYKELIIIDGGSTDGTVEILKKNNDKIAHWESKTDRGLYHALNKGLKQANGDWIYFLGSDDSFYSSQVLENIYGNINKLPLSIRMVYGKVVHCAADGSLINISGEIPAKRDYLSGMPIDHQAVFHHRSLFEMYGVFDERFKVISDLDHQLRLLFQYRIRPRFLPLTVAFHTHGGVSTRSHNRLLIWKETEEIRRKLGISIPIAKRLYRLASAFFWINLSWIMEEDFAWRLDQKLLKLKKSISI